MECVLIDSRQIALHPIRTLKGSWGTYWRFCPCVLPVCRMSNNEFHVHR